MQDSQDTTGTANVRPLKEAFKGKFLIGTALSVGALQGRPTSAGCSPR